MRAAPGNGGCTRTRFSNRPGVPTTEGRLRMQSGKQLKAHHCLGAAASHGGLIACVGEAEVGSCRWPLARRARDARYAWPTQRRQKVQRPRLNLIAHVARVRSVRFRRPKRPTESHAVAKISHAAHDARRTLPPHPPGVFFRSHCTVVFRSHRHACARVGVRAPQDCVLISAATVIGRVLTNCAQTAAVMAAVERWASL